MLKKYEHKLLVFLIFLGFLSFVCIPLNEGGYVVVMFDTLRPYYLTILLETYLHSLRNQLQVLLINITAEINRHLFLHEYETGDHRHRHQRSSHHVL